MEEAKKTNEIRGQEFITKYLTGKVIDIGAGNDLVCSWAERFDKEDGDANHISQYREANSYDTVHSSHCLEHMYNPQDALAEWWKLIKPGGYLVVVVPDEDLYEQGFWPSRFNKDHKATFTLKQQPSWSPVSYNVSDIVAALPDAEVISAEIHDRYYDRDLQTKYPPPEINPVPFGLKILRKICYTIPFANKVLGRTVQDWIFATSHVPIDQTLRGASAQIQVVAKKI
jgi:SAM-dependent methyltransferase